jgi:transcriptional regulator with XRE-family HTH domain
MNLEMPRKRVESSGFGERLMHLRTARGLTQVQLAEAAGLTQRAISYYENHHGFPPAPALVVLGKALRVSTDELLGVKATHAVREERDPEAQRLWKKFQRVGELPEKDQRAVIRLINSLAQARSA